MPIFSNILKRVKNNSDPAAVLEAGWGAMQAADPRLAQAVAKLPPQLAQQAVLQYTNAIRSGKEAEAGKIATDQIRTGLAEFAQSQPAQPQQGRRFSFGGAAAAAPKYEIGDLDAFEAALAPQSQGASPIPNVFGRLGKQLQQRQAAQDAAAVPAAFQQVKDKYNAFNEAGKSEYEKNLLWDTPKDRDLTVPTDWTPKKNALPILSGNDFA